MKQYLERLRQIHDEGHSHEDRTGVGRRSIFGTQDRYPMADGFPLDTTRKIFTKALILETLWFIRGSYDASELQKEGVKIWDKWAVTEEHIKEFAKKYSHGDAEVENMIVTALGTDKIGTIGMMYGAMWRNAPQIGVHQLWPDVAKEDMPSDKLAVWTEEYEAARLGTPSDELPTFEQYIKARYYQTVDQLNELIINLKKRPYSSRHVVTAWIPSHVPFETLSPEENVLLERGALAACHAMFQCFVHPPVQEGGKKRLSLQMYIR